MQAERPASSRIKVYSDRVYLHTTLVRHQGTTVALAMDESRRLHYSVLDLDAAPAAAAGDAPGGRADLDVHHWSEEPRELSFPREIARVGFAGGGAIPLPRVRRGGRAEQGPGEVFAPEETDPFLSSTARLSAAVPFQAVSDGRYVLVFRQAVGADHQDTLFHLRNGGSSGDRNRTDVQPGTDGNPLPIAADGLLCDRFLLTGGALRPVQEVRYRRSRHRDLPESAKDSLGTTDMDGNPFHEPTLHLGFTGRLIGGRFAVLLLPSAVSGLRRWQFFTHDAAAERIDAINVEQGADGLFHTRGTRLYTSPDARYQDSVLERAPGVCPFTQEPLVPVAPDTRFAESALSLPGDSWAEVTTGAETLGLGRGAYTVEAWLNPDSGGGTILSTRNGATGGISLALDARGTLVLWHGGPSDATVTSGSTTVASGVYTHVAAVHDGVRAQLYINGESDGEGDLAAAGAARPRMLLVADPYTAGAVPRVV
ncbi:hypothetical protein SSCG_01958 [Streptomyces clavuligerus]|nr:LamG domain-containing protein [Streptomyces clavuligerus]EDY48930.1 hypothetical protein SSCG_01958 [Streptomyces clavuligerus]